MKNSQIKIGGKCRMMKGSMKGNVAYFLILVIFFMVLASLITINIFPYPKNADFLSISKEFASQHPIKSSYDAEKYNCVNYSVGLVEKLRDAGYLSTVIIGDLDKENSIGKHAWVGVLVQINPQTGNIINQNDDKYKLNTIGGILVNGTVFGKKIIMLSNPLYFYDVKSVDILKIARDLE